MHILSVIAILLFYFFASTTSETEVLLNSLKSKGFLDHFWTSTGLCPPDPKNEIYKFLLSKDTKINLALIGALPNRGIEQIRVHWLLFLLGRLSFNGELDFTLLDKFLKFLIRGNLKPRFELMGIPSTSDNWKTERFWENLVYSVVNRYISKWGDNEVASWKFELWNEPDLKTYNILNFTLRDYTQYVNGCAAGLKEAFRFSKNIPVLGGPAGLFREENHPFCWSLLESCNREACPIQFISFHRKGNGTAEGVLNGTLELLDLLHNKFPNLRELPIANDEADIKTTWSDSQEWLGDVRYAAMVSKVIISLHKSLVLDRKLKIESLSNDNAFLNYHPFYFTQRTFFARFQMNRTQPPHSQFIKKPVYSVMALLSILGNEVLAQDINCPDPRLSVISTMMAEDQSISLLLAYGDEEAVNIETIKHLRVCINNLSTGSRFVIYLLDNTRTNPFDYWQKVGSPVFPNQNVRRELRKREEPFRIQNPTSVSTNNLTLNLNLTLPSIALIHICQKPLYKPGQVSKLRITRITVGEVLLTWGDYKVKTKCIRTYEVEFKSTKTLNFQRINVNDTIFLSYHHAPTGGLVRGRYRVRAVDYWDQPGNYSKIVSVV